ncbi:MAG TPA: hypothetical protein VN493_06515 [Thermoanaerobaculia bacterium]|nr:hypothetical protein [Thermoanaerobaculia bacterium]
MATNSYADYIRHWGHIDDRVKSNPELSSLEPQRAQLEIERKGLQEATIRQATLRGQSQKASRDTDGHVARGRDLATRLRDGIRAHYGREEEKLAEFGMNPRRPKKPAPPPTEPPPPPVEIKKPSETGPNPSQTASPGAVGTTKE